MDERLRKIERRARSTRSAEDIGAYLQALIHTGEGHRFIQGFRSVSPQTTPTTSPRRTRPRRSARQSRIASSDEIRNLLRESPLVQVACLGHGLELIEIQLRDYFLKLAAETGIWHGILPLNEEEITYYNQAIRLGYLEPRPEDEDDVEAWQNDQDAIIYTYFRGLPEVMRIANDEPLTINPATWVDLDCKLGEARLAVTWKNQGEYLPDWDGISFEDAKMAGPPGEILGSYRLVTQDYYPGPYDDPELDAEMLAKSEEEASELLHGDLHRISDGTFRIRYCPEMWLHIVRCASG